MGAIFCCNTSSIVLHLLQRRSSCRKRPTYPPPLASILSARCFGNSWQMSCVILSPWCQCDHKGPCSFTECFCRAMLILAGSCDVISGSLLHRRGKPQGPAEAPRTSLDVTGQQFATARCSLIVFLDGEVWLQRGRSAAPHRVTPCPSSAYLCFPCKVWGFSKQTGGDKHMLWTALRWVVSEVQRSRSLSGCGHTSHSEMDNMNGAPCFYPTGDKCSLGSHGLVIRESGWRLSPAYSLDI